MTGPVMTKFMYHEERVALIHGKIGPNFFQNWRNLRKYGRR